MNGHRSICDSETAGVMSGWSGKQRSGGAESAGWRVLQFFFFFNFFVFFLGFYRIFLVFFFLFLLGLFCFLGERLNYQCCRLTMKRTEIAAALRQIRSSPCEKMSYFCLVFHRGSGSLYSSPSGRCSELCASLGGSSIPTMLSVVSPWAFEAPAKRGSGGKEERWQEEVFFFFFKPCDVSFLGDEGFFALGGFTLG